MQPRTTLADLRRDAETDVHITAADATTPADTFLATTKILGVTTTYLLAGEPGAENAPVLGRIEYGTMARPMRAAYAGGGLKGGHYLGAGQDEDVFTVMIARANRVFGQDAR